MDNKIKNSVIGLIVSVYIACSFIVILTLPNMFGRFITWIGNEDNILT